MSELTGCDVIYAIKPQGRIREPPLPDLAGMMAHRAGKSRHNRPSCRLEIPFTGRYLEFVCVQVQVRLGKPAILYAQRPTARALCGCDGSHIGRGRAQRLSFRLVSHLRNAD